MESSNTTGTYRWACSILESVYAHLARSYFRIFYHFPGGHAALQNYLKVIDKEGLDWKPTAHSGSAKFQTTAPQIPVGTEVVLMQLLITLDDALRPVPTRIVESVQLRTFRNVDGKPDQVRCRVALSLKDRQGKRLDQDVFYLIQLGETITIRRDDKK